MYNLPTPQFTPIKPDSDKNAMLCFWREELEKFGTESILQWSIDTFGPQVAFAPSWSEEDEVIGALLEKMSCRIPAIDRIHTLLLSEAWAPLEPHEIAAATFDGRKAGAGLWARFHQEHLCKIYEEKVVQYKAWIVPVRRDQESVFKHMPILSWNERFGVFRIAPLAACRKEKIQNRIRRIRETIADRFEDRIENEIVETMEMSAGVYAPTAY